MKRHITYYGGIAALAVAGVAIWLNIRPGSMHQPADEQALLALPVVQDEKAPVSEINALQSNSKPMEVPLSDAVQSIVDPHISYEACTRLIKALGRDLSPEDVEALRGFLHLSTEDSTMRPIILNSLKTDVLDALIDQEQLPEGLAQEVVGMSSDSSLDYMWQEYCLQFMAPLYDRVSCEMNRVDATDDCERGQECPLSGAGTFQSPNQIDTNRNNYRGQELEVGESPPAEGCAKRGVGVEHPQSPPAEGWPTAGVGSSETTERQLVRETLFFALNERDEDMAGTALLGLTRLARKHSEFDPKEIAAWAVEIAEDQAASSRCRLTAMRVAAMYGDTNILVAVRDLAVNSESDFLRGAALATLGEMGTKSDKALLMQCAESGNRQIAAAAKPPFREEPQGTCHLNKQ